jgi:hypothetical protein
MDYDDFKIVELDYNGTALIHSVLNYYDTYEKFFKIMNFLTPLYDGVESIKNMKLIRSNTYRIYFRGVKH